MTTETPTSFTPEDIMAAVYLIDHACENGAYKGWEVMQTAFAVRNRLVEFAESWKSIYQLIQGDEQK